MIIEGIMLFLVLLVVLFLMSGIKIVRQGYQYTIEHFGRFTAVARPASTSTCPSSTGSAGK
jgi:regulator of protease activity HflC (stomatin/prohibitin superfamily)